MQLKCELEHPLEKREVFEVSFVEEKVLKVFVSEINLKETGFFIAVEGCYLALYLIFCWRYAKYCLDH